MKFPFLIPACVLFYVSSALGPAYYRGTQPTYGFEAMFSAFFVSLFFVFEGHLWAWGLWACHFGTAANALAIIAMGLSQTDFQKQGAMCAGTAFVSGLLSLLILWLGEGFLPGAGAGVWLLSLLGLTVANTMGTIE